MYVCMYILITMIIRTVITCIICNNIYNIVRRQELEENIRGTRDQLRSLFASTPNAAAPAAVRHSTNV